MGLVAGWVQGRVRGRVQGLRVQCQAILQLIETSVGALIIWIIKQTNRYIANQTNKLSK